MIILKDFILNEKEQRQLFEEVKVLKDNLFKEYKRFGINMNYNIDENDVNVKQFYQAFYTFLNTNISTAEGVLESLFSSIESHDHADIINAIILYGSAICYLKYLSNVQLFRCTQKQSTLDNIKSRVECALTQEYFPKFKLMTFRFIKKNNLINDKTILQMCNMYNELLKESCTDIASVPSIL